MRLRTSIEARALEGGDFAIRDTATGLELRLSADAGALVQGLLRDGDGARAKSEEVEGFFEQLDSIGLSRELSTDEALRRQGLFILQQAAERELPRVRESVEHATRISSFHRSRLADRLAVLDAPEGLSALPLMSKEDLRAQFPEGLVDLQALKAGLDSGDLLFASTSGTTGDRLQVVSDTRLPRFPPNFLTLWQVGTFEPGYTPRTAVFTSPVCAGPVCHLGRSPMEERTVAGATLYLNSSDDIFSMDRALASNVHEELCRFKPDFLFVNPVYLAVLSLRTREWGMSLPPARAIVSCYQYLSHCQRRLLRSHFGCPIYDLYSATDLGGGIVAVECGEGGIHVRLDQVFLELVRGGKPVPPGELGQVAVTTHNRLMPLVRYVLGDLARWAVAPCKCELGSESPRLHLEGRVRDLLRVDGREISPRDVDEALRPLEGLAFYQLTEIAPGELELSAVPVQGGTVLASEVAEALSPLLGRAPRLRLSHRLRAERGQKFRLAVPYAEVAFL